MNLYPHHVAAVTAKGTAKLVVIPIIIALIVMTLLPGVGLPITSLMGDSADQAVNVGSTIGMMVGLVGGTFLMMKVSKISAADLGWHKKNAGAYAVRGILVGLATLTLVALILRLLGAITFSFTLSLAGIGPILLAMVFFAFQGCWEELVYRAYLMPHLTKAFGVVPAIVVTSLMFALLHGLNPGLGVMPWINLIVYGFVFAMLYYRTGSMWFTGLVHSAWNFAQGYLFGAEVSGNSTPASVIRSTPVAGHDLLSGGAFGFEGSLVVTLIGLAVIAVLALRPNVLAPLFGAKK